MADEPAFSDLLDAARSGDGGARDALFARLAADGPEAGRMLAIARRALPRGDPARDLVESRDLVQSALRHGWLDLDAFRGSSEAELMGWLRTILRRRLGRRTRRKTPRVGSGEPAEPRDDGSDEEETTATIVRQELIDRVRDEVAALPDEQRVVMERRLAGVPSKEVAEALGLAPATVRKRESRAMARLRERLGGD